MNAESDESPFSRCDECGGVFVRSSTHRCPDTTTRLYESSEGRARLAEADDGDPDDEVLHITGRGDSAYHEADYTFDLDAMLAPRVPACDTYTHESDYVRKTRSAVWRTSRYPCSRCYPEAHEQVETDGE